MKRSIFFVTRAALVAAAYFALATLLQPVSFGPVQFRLSEALVLLPLFMPEAVVGVTVGCFLTNFIYSTPYDVLFGTVATALAALLTCLLRRHRILAALPPVILNALLVPLIWVGVTYFIVRIAGKYLGAFLGCLAVKKPPSATHGHIGLYHRYNQRKQ